MTLRVQILRYVIVGLAINVSAFVAYLMLTNAGMAPAVAMTMTFIGALLAGFVVNRSITFAYRGKPSPALGRYLVTYATGYLLNLAGLMVLVDSLHVPHSWAQGGLVLLVAVVMFAMQRLWVFPDRTTRVPFERG